LLKYLNRKEVVNMADKKNSCGCGCIPLEKSEKAAKKDKNTKKSR
jgi:hypothetical protein